MAYIVDADQLMAGKPDGSDGLDLDQKTTVLRLARQGHAQCLKRWVEFAETDPVDAELVIKHLDADMAKAVKPQKAKRGRSLGKSAGKVQDQDAMVRADLTADLNHCDPGRRENARAALARLNGAG